MDPITDAERRTRQGDARAGRRRWTAALGLVGALALASCGGDDPRRLSEGEAVARADGLCAQHTQQIVTAAQSRFPTPEVPAADALVDFARQTVVPEAERLVRQLESLRPPEDQQEDFEEYLRDVNLALGRLKAAPSMAFSEMDAQDAFREANALAEDLGLSACARASQQWSDAPFLR